jgi:hypothetical protein
VGQRRRDAEHLALEVGVLPAQGQELAEPHAGPQRDDDRTLDLTIPGALQECRTRLGVRHVKVGTRCSWGADSGRRVGGDRAPPDGLAEHLREHPVDVDGRPRRADLEHLCDHGGDGRRTELGQTDRADGRDDVALQELAVALERRRLDPVANAVTLNQPVPVVGIPAREGLSAHENVMAADGYTSLRDEFEQFPRSRFLDEEFARAREHQRAEQEAARRKGKT